MNAWNDFLNLLRSHGLLDTGRFLFSATGLIGIMANIMILAMLLRYLRTRPLSLAVPVVKISGIAISVQCIEKIAFTINLYNPNYMVLLVFMVVSAIANIALAAVLYASMGNLVSLKDPYEYDELLIRLQNAGIKLIHATDVRESMERQIQFLQSLQTSYAHHHAKTDSAIQNFDERMNSLASVVEDKCPSLSGILSGHSPDLQLP